MAKYFEITGAPLDLRQIDHLIESGVQLKLSRKVIKQINFCRNYLENKMLSESTPIYGVNTGFGSLYKESIPEKDLEKLQQNLIRSHACGTGKEVAPDIIKLMLLFKIQSLSKGHSGVQVETVVRLVDMYNYGVIPVVYEMGSLGASGDLAPLAHLSLPLLGEGQVYYEGKKRKTRTILKKLEWEPLHLGWKEGLALLNGTQFMSAYGIYCLRMAKRLSAQADLIGAISLEAFDGRIDPFSKGVHDLRPHKGQAETARVFRSLLRGSKLIKGFKEHLQDPYSFRCIPQIHGATKDVIKHCISIFETEINSVTDNPTIFPETDTVVSAGNFHGQPLAMGLDYLSISLAELGSVSERRTYKLISGQRGLPEYLVAKSGLNSGFMVTQYTAASMVSQNKQLCTPSSVDTIDSSNGQEDHVSMGANAALKTLAIVQNLERILAIELFNASQAMEFRKPIASSSVIEKFLAEYRDVVPFVKEDKVMHQEIEASLFFIQNAEPVN